MEYAIDATIYEAGSNGSVGASDGLITTRSNSAYFFRIAILSEAEPLRASFVRCLVRLLPIVSIHSSRAALVFFSFY
jgi:hypothetical protein